MKQETPASLDFYAGGLYSVAVLETSSTAVS